MTLLSFRNSITGEIHVSGSPEGYAGEEWELVAEGADRPDPAAEIVEGAWQVPVAVLQQRQWARVKAIRGERELLASTPFGVVQSDQASKLNINGLVMMAQLQGASFSEEFTLADNTIAGPLSGQQMVQLGMAVGQHVSAVYARARALRDEIEQSSDPASVDIESGWP
ncbi:DUF4376 domain-containing protein [Sphingomonas ginkgonis]|uniref:DUF4376 domain-containing protein n=1 Tax=Sphingomonas ginkgonis TaxID=2315330 RepID=A0A3R9YLD6_9SPHN|nr:DUF4376 domain-containing protein [Sphingomonas ginkgonis]RST30166.1 DUF4376 domain-containing protein [Sphingomonas ginkgonis]